MNKKGIIWGLVRFLISTAILIFLIWLFLKYYDLGSVIECIARTCRR